MSDRPQLPKTLEDALTGLGALGQFKDTSVPLRWLVVTAYLAGITDATKAGQNGGQAAIVALGTEWAVESLNMLRDTLTGALK